LFPADLVVVKGDAYAAKKRAVKEEIGVLLELRASGSALRNAQRNDGLFTVVDLPQDAPLADLITTGFVMGGGIMVRFLKNRDDDVLPKPFLHYPRNPDLLWTLLDPSEP